MQKADKLDHAAKVVAMYVPPVVMALLGLLLQGKKSGRASAAARGKGTPAIKTKAVDRHSATAAMAKNCRRLAIAKAAVAM
jgi:hypothetical protein